MAKLRKLSRFQPSNWMNTPLLSRLLCLVSKPKLILLLSLQFVVCIGGKGSWEKKNSERNWICYGSGYNVHINKRLNNSFLNGSVLLCFEVKETEKEVTILILSIDRMIAKDILHSSIIKNECTRMLKKKQNTFL